MRVGNSAVSLAASVTARALQPSTAGPLPDAAALAPHRDRSPQPPVLHGELLQRVTPASALAEDAFRTFLGVAAMDPRFHRAPSRPLQVSVHAYLEVFDPRARPGQNIDVTV